MSLQVITIGSDGSLKGLQHKPHQGIDLRKFGKAHIERASEIIWDDDTQMWLVEFRKGASSFLDGVKLTLGMHYQIPLAEQTEDQKLPVLFDEYDEAVAAEIKYLNWARVNSLLDK